MTIAELQQVVTQASAHKPRGIDAVTAALSQTAKNWLTPNSPWRKRAVAEAPGPTGFSEAMVNEAIDLTFGILTADAFAELVDRELGDRLAVGPPVIAHFLAGNV